MSPIRRHHALATVLCLLAVCATARSALVPLARRDLCVTNGAITEAANGSLLVETESSRAIAPGINGRAAELRFRYLGRSASTRPLAAGELRQQIGLKLRAKNQCNLLYVMWRVEPDAKLVVLIKSNPGQSTHAECDAHGYTTIAAERGAQPPQPLVGAWHTLRAELEGHELTVRADGAVAWHGALPRTLDALNGPAGIRTDNARFAFTLFAVPGSIESDTRCQPEPGD
jgi:hypothetical protein